MEKDTKIFLIAFIILLIAIVSFNFNRLTDEGAEDITGTVTKTISKIPADKRISLSSCKVVYKRNVGGGLETLGPTCEKVIDNDESTMWSAKHMKNTYLTIKFPRSDVSVVYIKPYAYFNAANLKYEDITKSLGNLKANEWHTFKLPITTSLDSIELSWNAGDHDSGVYEVVVVNKDPETCYLGLDGECPSGKPLCDLRTNTCASTLISAEPITITPQPSCSETDKGKDSKTTGITTLKSPEGETLSSKTDMCVFKKSQGGITIGTSGKLMEVDKCIKNAYKKGADMDIVPGTCNVNEYFCSTTAKGAGISQQTITCDSICENGRCI